MYLGDAADVLVAVLLGKAQVLVQAEAHIVAVEAVGGQADVEEVLLEGGGHSGLARGRQAGEPDGEAALAAQLVPLMPGERRVPGDVAALSFSWVSWWAGFERDSRCHCVWEMS